MPCDALGARGAVYKVEFGHWVVSRRRGRRVPRRTRAAVTRTACESGEEFLAPAVHRPPLLSPQKNKVKYREPLRLHSTRRRVRDSKKHIGLAPRFSSESNSASILQLSPVSSGFLIDQHSWLPTPAVAARPRAPRNLLGFRRDRVHSLDNRPCHNVSGRLRRGSAILHMLGGLALGEAQQNLMQICSVGVPARASEGPHHQSS